MSEKQSPDNWCWCQAGEPGDYWCGEAPDCPNRLARGVPPVSEEGQEQAREAWERENRELRMKKAVTRADLERLGDHIVVILD